MKSLINSEVLPFNATAFHNGKFVAVSHANLRGKWSIVFFYPADFRRSRLDAAPRFESQPYGQSAEHATHHVALRGQPLRIAPKPRRHASS